MEEVNINQESFNCGLRQRQRNESISQSSNTSLSSTLLDQISDEDINFLQDSGKESVNSLPTSDISDSQSSEVTDRKVLAEDRRNKNISYFTLTYSNDENENPKGQSDKLNNTSLINFSEDDGWSEIEDTTMIFDQSGLQQKKASLKLFSLDSLASKTDRVQLSHTESMATVSPMEISSPDSLIGYAINDPNVLGDSEDNTCFAKIYNKTTVGNNDESLDDISSGEISSDSLGKSNTSQTTSDYWDEERYLSEYNYDEQIDEDRTRKFLDFGDDYRNFIDSMSDTYSSISGSDRKRSKRLTKRKAEKNEPYDTYSENEKDELRDIIEDSSREMDSIEVKRQALECNGLVAGENFHSYNVLMQICSDNLSVLINILKREDLPETFLIRKRSRDIRILLNKWEILHSRIKENIYHSETYEALKNDVLSFEKELTNILECAEETNDHTGSSVPLENKLHTFEDALAELTEFKSHLFELNLSVHNFLAEINSSNNIDNKVKFKKSVHLKDDVMDLYKLWDKAHNQTTGRIANTEEALKKLKYFENELLELRDCLKQDAKAIKERGNKKQNRIVGSKNSSGDSGISDDSAMYSTDNDISEREEHLSKLRSMAKSLEMSFPPSSVPILMIKDTLQATSDEFNDLKTCYRKYRTLKPSKPKNRPGTKSKVDKQISTSSVRRTTSFKTRCRQQVIRMTLFMNILLFITAALLWICHPQCCDSANTMIFSHQPQFKYVNGPPPI